MSWNVGELTVGPLPMWWQIADRLRHAITRGDFRPGDVLPSEAQLNEAFGVSRTTARTALDALENEGLIVRRSGKGSIVLDPAVEQPLNRLSSFSEDMRQRGLRASYETRGIDLVTPPSHVVEAFGVAPSDRVYCVERLLKAEGAPMGLSYSWISPGVLAGRRPPTVEELNTGSLYEWLERSYGAAIVGGTEIIEAAIAQRELAKLLEVPIGSAVLVAKRLTVGAGNQPIEYAHIHYRADRYRFRVELVRQ